MRIFETKHEILDFEGDMSGKLMLPNILSLAIMGSTKQSLAYEVGPDYTHAMGLGWIVLQHEIIIYRRPSVGETVTIQTHGKEFNPFFAKRDYTFLDEDSNKIIQIDSMYAMLDMEKRKMARIPDALVQAYQPDSVKRVPHLAKPLRFTNEEAADLTRLYQVRFSDIDSNQHVNNAKYLDWAQDPLGRDFLLEHEPQLVNIKFEHEVLLGETVVSKVIQQKNQTKHQIWMGDELAAEVGIKWTEN
ncbi:acyl-ACP thioesterase [Weissella coleopterorum]|uniref:Acyl-ACP thioesterase n=1 Tax=Weissella coleopterorum TaxID=2714949 RepID=A0A6G8B1T0_9LACO|nr:acyl-ACP thioesterase domain-containing protein [Weissella coleopterorum]QIL51206.1 acyl-ACP thioesterase [Weissella coleopterorum]